MGEALSEYLKVIAVGTVLFLEAKEDASSLSCPDYYHVLLLLPEIIRSIFTFSNQISYLFVIAFLKKILGMMVIGVFLIAIAFISHGRLGGADVKLGAAISFLLGAKGTIIGLFIASLAAIINEGIIERNRRNFAFIPYLAIGFEGALCLSYF